MKLKVFAIKDVKSEIYMQPRMYHSTPHAMRMFTVEHVNDKSLVGMYPDDFHVMEIGEWDDSTCHTTHNKQPKLVCTIQDLLNERQRHAEPGPTGATPNS